MPRLRDRPTADLVVLFLAAIVGVTVVGSVAGLLVVEAFGADVDLAKLGARIADVTNTLIGAIVGYLAGRGIDPTKEEPPHDDR